MQIFSVNRKVNRDFHLWNKILYEDVGNRSESRQVCRRTTTLGGATTTRGGETQIKSPFYFPMFIFLFLFIFIFIFIFRFIFYIYIYLILYLFLFVCLFIFVLFYFEFWILDFSAPPPSSSLAASFTNKSHHLHQPVPLHQPIPPPLQSISPTSSTITNTTEFPLSSSI